MGGGSNTHSELYLTPLTAVHLPRSPHLATSALTGRRVALHIELHGNLPSVRPKYLAPVVVALHGTRLAERDHPSFDRVSMDGVAIASKAVATGQREFSIQGTQAAGDPPSALVSSQHAIEIMTGAVLPQGCDAVVPVEQIRVAAGRATLSGDFKVAAHANVHARGSDCLQGTALLQSGIRLGAPEIAIAAGAGSGARTHIHTRQRGPTPTAMASPLRCMRTASGCFGSARGICADRATATRTAMVWVCARAV